MVCTTDLLLHMYNIFATPSAREPCNQVQKYACTAWYSYIPRLSRYYPMTQATWKRAIIVTCSISATASSCDTYILRTHCILPTCHVTEYRPRCTPAPSLRPTSTGLEQRRLRNLGVSIPRAIDMEVWAGRQLSSWEKGIPIRFVVGVFMSAP